MPRLWPGGGPDEAAVAEKKGNRGPGEGAASTQEDGVTEPTLLQVVNSLDEDISLVWVDFSGVEWVYSILGPEHACPQRACGLLRPVRCPCRGSWGHVRVPEALPPRAA
jgi:hypothetical protein